MNLILIFPEDFIHDDHVLLSGRRLQHLLITIQPKPGDQLEVGLVNGKIGTGEVLAMSSEHITLRVQLQKPPPAPLPTRLILALPRPKVLHRVLSTCSTLGVKEIILINSYRVDKSYWSTPLLKNERVTQSLTLGLEQAKDTMMPTIKLEKRFKPFVEDRLPALTASSQGLVGHPYATTSCPDKPPGHVTLAVGPEGGFIPWEINRLIDAGFQDITLGKRILKVETAVSVLIAKLFY